jgi:hypothetical protein
VKDGQKWKEQSRGAALHPFSRRKKWDRLLLEGLFQDNKKIVPFSLFQGGLPACWSFIKGRYQTGVNTISLVLYDIAEPVR